MMGRLATRGFTLIELMIVVVVIAILASIAFAAYQQFVIRAERAEAATAIQEIILRQERHRANNDSYAESLTDPTVPASAGDDPGLGLANNLSDRNRWSFALASVTGAGYRIVATKVAGLPDTRCNGMEIIVNAGGADIGGTDPRPADCWRR